MKTELHVDLKMAKLLKENNYPQEGCSAYWQTRAGVPSRLVTNSPVCNSVWCEYYAAPTVQEIVDDKMYRGHPA